MSISHRLGAMDHNHFVTTAQGTTRNNGHALSNKGDTASGVALKNQPVPLKSTQISMATQTNLTPGTFKQCSIAPRNITVSLSHACDREKYGENQRPVFTSRPIQHSKCKGARKIEMKQKINIERAMNES